MQKKTASLTAHRGGARLGPENSLTALRRAIALGIPYAEVDVQCTADGALVLLHDADLVRVAGVEKAVHECSLEELRRLTRGSEPVATLEESIAVVRGRMRLVIEMKDYGSSEALPERLVNVLREKDFLGGARVCSFSANLLQQVRAREPRVELGYVLDSRNALPEKGEVTFVSVAQEKVDASLVRQAHRRGLEVHAWTVNERETMLRLLALGVDNLVTDDPELGKRTLAEFGRMGWFARQWLRL